MANRLAYGFSVFVAALALPAAAGQSASYKSLYDFLGGTDGANPQGTPVLVDGYLYGTTAQGGLTGNGTIFKLDPMSGSESVIFPFDGTNGGYPCGPMTVGNGLLYGTACYGGTAGAGLLFILDPSSGVESTLFQFTAASGNNSGEGLTRRGNTLYGVTVMGGDLSLNGGYGAGTVYRIDAITGQHTLLHSFELSDGFAPMNPPAFLNGELYGTTTMWGSYGSGTLYRTDANTGATTVLHHFTGGADGGSPEDGVIVIDGALYGTTSTGGAYSRGAVYKFDLTTGMETVLYSFKGGYDGVTPEGTLAYYRGSLYGTTYNGGGPANAGTVYKVNIATHREQVLHSFAGGTDGANPRGGLIQTGGDLYGTTWAGGSQNLGTVFSITP